MVYRRPARATAATSAPEDTAAVRDDAPDVVSAAMVPFAWRYSKVSAAESIGSQLVMRTPRQPWGPEHAALRFSAMTFACWASMGAGDAAAISTRENA